MKLEVTHLPGLAQPGVIETLAPFLRTGTAAAAHRFRAEVAGRSPGGIGPTWTVTRLAGVGALSWAVTTPHPGAAPLNNGATFPGAMPPWGPGTPLAAWAEAKGIPPFLVARKLKRDGLQARHFVEAAFTACHSDLTDLVHRGGVLAFLEALPRG